MPLNKSMPLVRYLRMEWTVFWCIAALVFIVLWMRSYSLRDAITWRYNTPHSIRVISLSGRVSLQLAVEEKQVIIKTYTSTPYEYWGPAFHFDSSDSTPSAVSYFLTNQPPRSLYLPYWVLCIGSVVSAIGTFVCYPFGFLGAFRSILILPLSVTR